MPVFRRVFSAKLPLIVACIAWVMAGEVFFRLPVVAETLFHYVNEAQWATNAPDKLRILRQQPGAQVWYIGSSAVHHDLDPARIDALWGGRSLNLGLVGVMDVRFMRQYLNEVFLPVEQPRAVLVGVLPYWFAFSLPEPYKTTQEHIGIHVHEWDYQLGSLLAQRSAIYRFNKAFSTFFLDQPTGVNLTHADGFEPRLHRIDEVNPSAPIIPEVTENDRLESSLQALLDWRDELAARGVQVLLVAMPLHHAIIDHYPGGVGNFDAYRARLQVFSAENGMAYLDLHGALEAQLGAPVPDRYFSEYTHLNDEGAAQVAPLVGQFLSAQLVMK